MDIYTEHILNFIDSDNFEEFKKTLENPSFRFNTFFDMIGLGQETLSDEEANCYLRAGWEIVRGGN